MAVLASVLLVFNFLQDEGFAGDGETSMEGCIAKVVVTITSWDCISSAFMETVACIRVMTRAAVEARDRDV